MTITNSGQLPYLDTAVTMNLAGVLDDATYNNDAAATGGGTVTLRRPGPDLARRPRGRRCRDGQVHRHSGQSRRCGDQSLVSTAVSAAAGNNCPSGSTDPQCTVTVPVVSVQTLTITKAVQGGATVTAPGRVVGYVITMTNSAPTAFVGATFTDDLVGRAR